MINRVDYGISRRQFLASTSFASAIGLLAPHALFAGTESVSGPGLVEKARTGAASATITVDRLRGNISILLGAGGNIAVLPGRDGKLLIDAGFAGARPKITSTLASISSDPIKHLINTHWHFDHTDGNEWLHSEGAAILAHTNTRKHLSSTTRVEGWNFTFPPSPPGAIPAEVFDDERTVNSTGRRSPSSTTPPPTPTAISPFTSWMPIFSTSATPSGTASIRSLIIRPAEASTA